MHLFLISRSVSVVKKTVLILTLILPLGGIRVFSQSLFPFAKDTSKVEYRNDLGIDFANVMTFLKRNTQSYLINYRYRFSDNAAFRFGLNLDVSNKKDKGHYTDAMVGIECRKGKESWSFYYGLDLSYSYWSSNTQTSNISRYGISPLIGVRYYFSRHFSLSTEAKLNYFYDYYSKPGSFDPNFQRESYQLNIGSVGMVIFAYHF